MPFHLSLEIEAELTMLLPQSRVEVVKRRWTHLEILSVRPSYSGKFIGLKFLNEGDYYLLC